MNTSLNEIIRPEVLQAAIAQASTNGVSVNDYLAGLLGLTNGHGQEREAQALTPYELASDLIGAVDSNAPGLEPAVQPRRTAFGAHLAEKHRQEIARATALRTAAEQQGLMPDEWVRRNFPHGRDAQNRSLAEALDNLAANADQNGTH